LSHGLEPGAPLDLNKNHVGLVLGAGFLVVFAAAPRLEWPFTVITALRVLMLVGLVASQSRAAALGLVATLAMRPLLQGRRGQARTVSITILVACIGLLAVTAVSINDRDLSRSDSDLQFNAINARTEVISTVMREVWLKNRFVGGGLRYFNDPDRPYPTPHNLVVGELTEAGLVGLVGLVGLLIATVLALRRSRAELAGLAMMALVLRFTQGLADIFWVAGPLTVAMILVGLGITDDPGTGGEAPSGATVAHDASDRLAPSRQPL